MITAIAIDDEPLGLVIIKAFCSRVESIDLQKTFTEPNEALKHIQKYPVDLLFLDIQMPSISGIDLYKAVGQNTMVIFTTAYSQYAVEGFNLSAIDYLLKPFDFERFKKAVDKAQEYHTYLRKEDKASNPYLFIRADYSLVKIALADIIYIEGLDNYLKIHLKNAKPLVARMSMKNMIDKLPEKDFIRVHRSYIVSIADIKMVRNKTVYLSNAEVPVGANYADALQQVIGTK
jgi:DNA-binding LytR/AlgR family response regulator